MGLCDPNASPSRAEAASKLPGCSCGDGLPGDGHADGCSSAWKMSSSAATACRRWQKDFECLQGNDRDSALRQSPFRLQLLAVSVMSGFCRQAHHAAASR